MIVTTYSDTHPLIKALQNEGVEVLLARNLRCAAKMFENNRCRGYYGNIKFDIKSPMGLYFMCRSLRARQIPYVYWNRDAPWNEGMKPHRIALLRGLKPIDIYLTHSPQGAHRYAKQSHYFPNAANDFYCTNIDLGYLRNEDNYEFDICFIGSVGNSEWLACEQRLNFIAALSSKVRGMIPNVKFKIVDTYTQKISISEQIDLIRKSKINLNFGAICDMPDNPSWGLPERVFGIPAAGGFLLTDYRKMIVHTFQRDVVDSFVDIDQCVQMIVFYLSHFNQLRARAESLHDQVLKFHTYSERAKTLLHLLSRHADSCRKLKRHACA